MRFLHTFAAWSVAAAAFLPLASLAQDKAVVSTERTRAELLAHAPEGIAAGKPLWLGLQLTHQPGWHSYWKNPGDSGLPTQLQWTLPSGMDAAEIAWPAPEKMFIGPLANYGYEGTVLLPVPVTV
ncbi:MAG: thiol-disulfide interchange protein DsbD-like protein, partial [Ramlibacter sp.]|nr:thiol-disulfide interchange protein DsbD-like protein [Ramlibacter sp.]